MTITSHPVCRSTSCLVLGWGLRLSLEFFPRDLHTRTAVARNPCVLVSCCYYHNCATRVSISFYRAKLRVARYCHGKLSVRLSVCPSVRPSVTLRYRDHIGWNSAKIISELISLTSSLFADPNITDLLQRERPQILAGI